MTHLDIELDLELASLRARRRSPGLVAWMRRFRPFDRRAIRNPADRDAYWAVVQQRLAESDIASLRRYRDGALPARPSAGDRASATLIG